MLYKVTVFKIGDLFKKRIYSVELQAMNPLQAIEQSCIKMGPDRLMEIQEIHEFKFPKVNRISRDAIL